MKALMQNPQIISDILQWDVKSWTKPLLYWEKNIDWDSIENCMEIGARQGGLSLWLALKGKKVVCTDLIDTQQTAEALHKKYNVENNITYLDINAANIPFENQFDLIVFKSIIGGIGKDNNFDIQVQVFKEIHKALKPGGKLLFAENLKASFVHQAFRKVFVKWGNSWRYVSYNEFQTFLEPFSAKKMKTTGFLATFGRSNAQRKLLYEIDNNVLNPIIAEKYKYICYGIAEK